MILIIETYYMPRDELSNPIALHQLTLNALVTCRQAEADPTGHRQPDSHHQSTCWPLDHRSMRMSLDWSPQPRSRFECLGWVQREWQVHRQQPLKRQSTGGLPSLIWRTTLHSSKPQRIRSINHAHKSGSTLTTLDPKRAELMTFNDSWEANKVRLLSMLNRCPSPFDAFDKPGGEAWLVNGDQQLVVQFKPDSLTNHGQWIELRTYIWVRPHPPVPQSRRKLTNQNASETWKHMVKVGWRRCAPPVRWRTHQNATADTLDWQQLQEQVNRPILQTHTGWTIKEERWRSSAGEHLNHAKNKQSQNYRSKKGLTAICNTSLNHLNHVFPIT